MRNILEDVSSLLKLKKSPVITKPIMNPNGTPYKSIKGGMQILPTAIFAGTIGAALLKKHVS